MCSRMNIPLTQAGHWVRVRFGKKVRTIPLSASYDGDKEVTLSIRTGDERKDYNELAVLAKEIKYDKIVFVGLPLWSYLRMANIITPTV